MRAWLLRRVTRTRASIGGWYVHAGRRSLYTNGTRQQARERFWQHIGAERKGEATL